MTSAHRTVTIFVPFIIRTQWRVGLGEVRAGPLHPLGRGVSIDTSFSTKGFAP